MVSKISLRYYSFNEMRNEQQSARNNTDIHQIPVVHGINVTVNKHRIRSNKINNNDKLHKTDTKTSIMPK